MTRAARPARRRTAAPLRRVAALRPALFEGPSDHQPQPRALSAAIAAAARLQPAIVIGIVGDEVIVDDMPLAKADGSARFVRRLQQIGVERITIDRGVTADEIATVHRRRHRPSSRDHGRRRRRSFPALPHIRVGRVTVEQRVEGSLDRHGDVQAALQRRRVGGRRRLGQRADRRAARRDRRRAR